MNKSKTEADNYIGKLLSNRYFIKDLLGLGGMGRVYLAEDIAKGGKLVAIKMLRLNLVNEQIAQRFGREIFIGAQLGRKSKNIVRLFSYGVTEEKIPFYVMEYLQGKTLKQILKTQTLSLEKILEISQQLCLGLQCAHKGVSLKGQIYPIVHRDIKPENIFINENSKNSETVKILDFGIAKFLTESSGMTLTESFVGSLPYCSPEHMEGQLHLDVRSDIYSLGLIMFEMITGKHPFHTTSRSFGTWYQLHRFQNPPKFTQVNPQVKVPQKLEELVMWCLAKDVSDRPQSIKAVLEVLKTIDVHPTESSLSSLEAPPTDSISVKLVPITSVTEKECLQQTWPKNKPIAPIVFPYLLPTTQGLIPTFWAMLPRAEIEKLINKTHTTEFISKITAYPMVLWITILYDQESSLSRWLSYYLDIKDEKGEKIVNNLAKLGYYHLLFFPLESPDKCAYVKTLNITVHQRQKLADEINLSHTLSEYISAKQAKDLLKKEYDNVKAKIIKRLSIEQQDDTLGLKPWIAKLFDKLF
ncbi:serine/threonine protein kinase [Richelia sinica]|nr:serine/threonine-protein kinase [Richelia sinica]MBD2663551.1 serine/threonine protein kinase [Richelia sinica FACHB-800]